MDWHEFVMRATGGRGPNSRDEEEYLRRAWYEQYADRGRGRDYEVRMMSRFDSLEDPRHERTRRQEEAQRLMMMEQMAVPERYLRQPDDPKDEKLEKYRSRKLAEYSNPKFDIRGELLPKEMVPFAVKIPKEDIKNRIASYLATA